ncbi:MAG: PH domain-containing protein [Nocardioidaceae bacterium]
MANAAVEAAGPRTERFILPMGRYLGYVAVVAAAVLIVFVVISDGGYARGFVCFSLAFALLSYVVLIRPEVTANRNGLLMRNMLRDTFLPWASVKGCRVAQTLQVSTRDKIYHGLGVSRSARAANKERRHARRETPVGPNTGLSPVRFMPASIAAPSTGVNMAKQEHVIENAFTHTEERIGTLAMEHAAATADQSPVVAWDWIPVAALGAAVVAVIVAVIG